MPPIPNWTRLDETESQVARQSLAAWQNTETGEVVYLGDKVPNDGYYAMRIPSNDPGELPGVRVGFHHRRRDAYKKATGWMRSHPEGELGGRQ